MDPRRWRALLALATTAFLTTSAFAAPEPSARKNKPSPAGATVVTPPAPGSSGEIEALRDAKRRGDTSSVEALHDALGWASSTPPSTGGEGTLIMRAPARRAVPGGPDPLLYDQPISDPTWDSGAPDVACTSGGILYTVVEDLGADYLDLYRSTNGGYTWDYFRSLADTDPRSPSIAIGEGISNRLMVAYVIGNQTASAAIKVWWYDLDTGASETRTLVAQPFATLAEPRICVDSPEYTNWYPYVTWVRSVVGRLATQIEFSRSLDYGATFEAPAPVASSLPDDVEHDIDFGGNTLHVVYTRDAGGNHDVYLRRSVDFGGSFDTEVGIAATALDEFEPRVAATVNGDMVAIAFTKEYTVTDTDVEAYVTSDGTIWNLTYLPYSSELERAVDLAAHVTGSVVHAAYYRVGDIRSSWLHGASPGTWSAFRVVNEGGFAHADHPPAITSNPTRAQEASIAWVVQGPDRMRAYYDAEYPVGDYLLVLASGTLISPAQSFQAWKETIGYAVSIVTVEQIFEQYASGDDAERIRAYLADRADNLRHVLLVGDVDELPMRSLYPSDTRPAYGSDFYYADVSTSVWDVDGDDRWGEFVDDSFNYHPDLVVGRLPFNDATTFQTFCNNVIAFEQESSSWKRNVLFSHGFLDFGSHSTGIGTDCAHASQAIISGPLSTVGWGYTRQYEEGGIYTSSFPSEDDLEQTNFRARLGWGQHGVVSGMAHGNRTHLAGVRWIADLNESFTNDMPEESTHNWFSHWDQISLDPAVGLVGLWGCSTGALLGTDPCFEESGLRSRYLIRITVPSMMMKEYLEHGAGAVMASTAGSDYAGGWTTSSQGGQQSFTQYYFEALTGTYTRAGDALHRAAIKYADTHGLARGLRVFHCFGDPTLSVADINVPGGLPRLANGIQAVPVIAQLSSDSKPEHRALSCGPSSVDWTKIGELGGALSISGLVGTESELFAAGMASDGLGVNQGVVYRSLDAGVTWSRQNVSTAWSIRSIVRTDTDRLVATGCTVSGGVMEGAIYTSDDDGAAWTMRLAVPGALVTDVVVRGSGDLIAVTANGGGVYRSSDEGTSWALIHTFDAGVSISSIHEISDRLFLTLDVPNGYSPVQRSYDGTSWVEATGLGSVGGGYDLVGGWDGAYYLAAQRTDDTGRLYRSYDAGDSWTEMPEPPDLDVRAIHALLVGPDGGLYVGASTGVGPAATRVYLLPMGSSVWEQQGADIDVANSVHDMAVHGGNIYIGTGDLYGEVYAIAHGAIVDVPEATPAFGLSPGVPNPFASRTAIRYSLPRESDVTLRVFDAQGREVRVLVGLQRQGAGTHTVEWDGRNHAGGQVPPGVYFYRLETSGGRLSGRVVLAR